MKLGIHAMAWTNHWSNTSLSPTEQAAIPAPALY